MEFIIVLKLMTLIVTMVLNTAFMLLVYFSNPKSLVGRLFGLFCFSTMMWLVVNFIASEPSTAPYNIFWMRLGLFFAVPQVLSFFLFAHAFPEDKLEVSKIKLTIIVSAALAVSYIVMSPYAFQAVEMINGSLQPVPGLGFVFFAAFAFGYAAWSVLILYRKRNEDGENRNKVALVLAAIFVMFGLITTTILLPIAFWGNDTFIPFGPLYTMIFFGIVAFAIVKHRLFNIKLIATQALVFALWTIYIAKIFTDDTATARYVDGIIFIALVVLGYLLTKSVQKEVEQREKLEVLTKELEEKNVQLQKLDKLKSEFLSFASHQVKSPMAVVKGYAQLMLDGSLGKINSKVSDTAQKMKEVADRLIGLVNELLDLRKLEEGKMTYDFGDVDMIKVIKDYVDEMQTLAKQKKLKLSFESELKEAHVNADLQKIQQVVQNLIDNSIKYTPEGWIRVSAQADDGHFVFSVQDSGLGMSKELLANLFEQFMRDKNSRKIIQGTGLGLYIAKQIVEGHSGKIWAESEGEGKGSTMKFTLARLKENSGK